MKVLHRIHHHPVHEKQHITFHSTFTLCGLTMTTTPTTNTTTASYSKVLFENDRMRLSDMRLPPGIKGGCESHEFPTLRWQVNAGHVSISKTDMSKRIKTPLDDYNGSSSEENNQEHLHNEKETQQIITILQDIPDKAMFWIDRKDSFFVTNANKTNADTEYRQIVWEFKQEPKHTEAQVQALLDQAVYPTNVGTTFLYQNQYCRVWDFYLEPGQGDLTDVHHHVLDYCFIYVAKGRLLGGHAPDGKPGLFDSQNEDGAVKWFDIPDHAPLDASSNYAHSGVNGYDHLPMREYLVELK